MPPGPEVIDDGINGLLIDPYNPNDIADKIINILQNEDLAQRLVGNASKSIERFSLEQCMNKTITFYNECLNVARKGK